MANWEKNPHQESGCSFQFAFMGYFYYVNNYKLNMGSELVLDLMLLKSFCFGYALVWDED